MKPFAWLIIPFACACASECGAPIKIVSIIILLWIVSTFAILEHMHQKELRKVQRRLDECRAKAKRNQ